MSITKSQPPIQINNFPQYQTIAYKFYQDYQKFQEEYSSLLDKYGQFDVLTHTPKEQTRYQKLLNERQTYCIASLIFEAFACEAYMNYICESVFGSDLFQKIDNNKLKLSYKTNSTTGKLKYFCENNPLGGTDIDAEIKNKVKILIETRNDLAHNKIREVRLDMEAEEVLYTLWNMGVKGDSIYRVLENSIGICQMLITETNKIIKLSKGRVKKSNS